MGEEEDFRVPLDSSKIGLHIGHFSDYLSELHFNIMTDNSDLTFYNYCPHSYAFFPDVLAHAQAGVDMTFRRSRQLWRLRSAHAHIAHGPGRSRRRCSSSEQGNLAPSQRGSEPRPDGEHIAAHADEDPEPVLFRRQRETAPRSSVPSLTC